MSEQICGWLNVCLDRSWVDRTTILCYTVAVTGLSSAVLVLNKQIEGPNRSGLPLELGLQ